MPTAFKSVAIPAVGSALALAILALVGVPISAAVPTAPAGVEADAFTVPAEDGYGIGDCMHAGSACGQVIANSWCEAHGHARAVTFTASDVTGSIRTLGTGPMTSEAVTIRCGDDP